MWKRSIAVSTASLLLAACGAKAPMLRSTVTGQLAPCKSSCVSSQAADAGDRVDPFTYTGSPVAAREKLGRVLGRMQSMGYSVVVNEGDYIHATYADGGMMKSASDLEFVFSQSERGIVHVRSASRGGVSDFGANRKHIEEVRNAYNVAKN